MSPDSASAASSTAHPFSGEAIENEARRLYDASPVSKPTWDQLGEVTKSVWRGYARGEPRTRARPATRLEDDRPMGNDGLSENLPQCAGEPVLQAMPERERPVEQFTDQPGLF
jgi:hypothetical protein